jgi:hypothetical protein
MRAWVTAVALAACLIVLAGCGGGGDDSSSSTSASVPQVTTPGQFNPGRESSSSTPTAPRATPGNNPAAPANRPPGSQPVQVALAPFHACLSRHGVDPTQFRPGFQGQGGQQQDPAERQKQIQAGIACIPELPPRLRKAAERLKRRYQQQTP